MPTQTTPLKAAYQRSGLSFLGITYERALSVKAIRIALECAAGASIEKTGKPAPIQPALI